MPIVPLVGQSYELKARNLSSQRTINWFLKSFGANSGAKSLTVMAPTPGAVAHLVIGSESTKCRGLYTSSSGTGPDFTPRLYGVWGATVYRFNVGLTAAYALGTVTDNGNPVSMTDNGFSFVVVDGLSMYEYPLSAEDGYGALVAVGMPEIPGITPSTQVIPTAVSFLGQRLIINSANSNQWFYSDLGSTNFTVDNTSTSYVAALSWYTAESSSDPILSQKISNGTLWIHGFRSYELWRTTDNADDPYSFVAGSQSSIGITSAASVATINNNIFWLGSSDVGAAGVYMGAGTTAERISTPAIEDQIQKLGTAQSIAIGQAYSWKGYLFYILAFPGTDRTYVYEAVTQTWCERLLRDLTKGDWHSYPYVYMTYYNNAIYSGLNLADSTLCRMDDDTYTEWDGRQVVRQRITPCYFEDFNNITLKEIIMDCEVGTTPLLTGQGSNPQMLLEISRDGGASYGRLDGKPIGKQGQYRIPVRWHAKGMGRSIVLRFTFADPCPCTVFNARLDYAACSRT
jgi:hypothetical protein